MVRVPTFHGPNDICPKYGIVLHTYPSNAAAQMVFHAALPQMVRVLTFHGPNGVFLKWRRISY